MTNDAIWAMLVATLLGLMIGLERERKRAIVETLFAGVRTFTLVALLGAISGLLIEPAGIWPMIVTLAGLSLLIGLGYWRASSGRKVGATTEVAAFVTFALGVMAGMGTYAPALAGAVLVTGVLSLREELHGLAGGLTRDDLLATVRFAVVSLVVFPLVPNEPMGPWGVWNPQTIWLFVVLISGVSFVGYVAMKWIGAKRGIGLSGLLGGVASSTATTWALARRASDTPALARTFAVGTLAASAVSAPRLIVLIAVLRPQFAVIAAVPLAAAFLVLTAIGLVQARRNDEDGEHVVQVRNPFELRPALAFAGFYALIALLVRAADIWLGTSGILIASTLAGVTQLDAITVSLADQVRSGLAPVLAGQALGFAFAANSLFKAALGWAVGGAALGRHTAFALVLAGAAAAAAGWWGVPWLASLIGTFG